VVLASSGRAALRLCLQDLGLSRYRDKIAVSPMTAQCVLEPVIRHGFPVDPAEHESSSCAATLLIHQYGVPQCWTPSGSVVEDICHRFFAAPQTGARQWRGRYAIFSIPKFFSLSGMAGGIVAESEAAAGRLRSARDSSPENPMLDQDRLAFRSARTAAPDLEQAYLRALLHPQADPVALGGLPLVKRMAEAGQVRVAIASRLVAARAMRHLPSGWAQHLTEVPPFVLPIFGDQQELARLDARLRDAGILAGIYRMDRRADNRRPDYQTAILLPCHQYIEDGQLDLLASILE